MDGSIITARGVGCQSGERFLIKDINWVLQKKQMGLYWGPMAVGKPPC